MSNGTAIVMREPTSALTTIDPRGAIAPRNPDDVWRMAETVAKSGLYGVKSIEEAMVRIATGMELGLSPMQSIRGVYVISAGGMSRPTLSADMMAAVIKSRTDVCRYFRMVESTDTAATYETQRVGEPAPVRMSYTIEQAKRAGLAGKGTWQQHPEAMLRARATSALARVVYPDILNGLYDPSEIEDIAPAPVDSRPVAVAEIVSQVVGWLNADDVIAHGATLATPADRKAYWHSIATDVRAWSKADRARVMDAFRALDEAPATEGN